MFFAGVSVLVRFDLSPPAVVLLILGVVLLSFAIFNLLVAVMVKQITTLASDSKDGHGCMEHMSVSVAQHGS